MLANARSETDGEFHTCFLVVRVRRWVPWADFQKVRKDKAIAVRHGADYLRGLAWRD